MQGTFYIDLVTRTTDGKYGVQITLPNGEEFTYEEFFDTEEEAERVRDEKLPMILDMIKKAGFHIVGD